jgi:ProP effector
VSKGASKVEATITELVARFPAAFTLDPTLVRPVKLGIKDDLYGQSEISHRRITAALRTYCNSEYYLKASTEGAVRIDLAGEPAGTVTATEARHATEGLAALVKTTTKRASEVVSAQTGAQTPKRNSTRKRSRPATAAPKGNDAGKRTPAAAPATPGQKRLSLSDLKRAAAARKAI